MIESVQVKVKLPLVPFVVNALMTAGRHNGNRVMRKIIKEVCEDIMKKAEAALAENQKDHAYEALPKKETRGPLKGSGF